MLNTKQIVKIFNAIGRDVFVFTSDTPRGIVYGILAAVENSELKFYHQDAKAMFLGGIKEEVERSKDTATLEVVKTFITKN